jgi:hypothetical protein
MADITGQYEFHTACPSQTMLIWNVLPDGTLISASIGDSGITGIYNAETNAISFNDAPNAGDVLFVKFYSGFVFPNPPDGSGGVCAMAGTYQELTLQREQLMQPGGGVQITTAQGSWYALWQEPLIP